MASLQGLQGSNTNVLQHILSLQICLDMTEGVDLCMKARLETNSDEITKSESDEELLTSSLGRWSAASLSFAGASSHFQLFYFPLISFLRIQMFKTKATPGILLSQTHGSKFRMQMEKQKFAAH